MNNRVVITIDGLAASGKTSIAKAFAKKINFSFLNSGLLYRGLASYLKNQSVSVMKIHRESIHNGSKNEIIKFDFTDLNKLKFTLQIDEDSENIVLINDTKLKENLFTPEISALTSEISAYPEIRTFLLDIQRNSFIENNLVAEGRDMGTVIFPNAFLKFYVTASVEVRARRRFKQLFKSSLFDDRLQDIINDIRERDKRDSEREISPAIPDVQAVIIDNSDLTLEETVEKIFSIYKINNDDTP